MAGMHDKRTIRTWRRGEGRGERYCYCWVLVACAWLGLMLARDKDSNEFGMFILCRSSMLV